METPQHKKRRFSGFKFTRRSAAIVVALLMVAAPASASIIVQNFMEADITAAPPCFIKTEGLDAANSTQASFDDTSNTIAVDGVDLLEEKISVTGMTGDRVVYTDVVHYENNCDEAINVVLTTDTVSGDWTNLAAEIWISNVASPAAVDPNIDVVADNWNNDYIIVPAGTPAGAFVDSTGVITVPAGSEVQGAFVVSSDVAFTAGTATVNWVAQATIN